MTEHIFISYSKKDINFAHKLADDLAAAGFKVWIDRSIGGGDDWRQTIEKNLRTAGDVIIVVSLNSMSSEWVRHEGSLAYGWEKRLIPILIEPIKVLPPWLEEYQWIDFVKRPYESAFDSLATALTPPNPIQDLLDQQLDAYKQTGELVGKAILQFIEEKRETLKMDDEVKAVLFRSSVIHFSNGQPWRELMSSMGRRQLIAHIQQERKHGDHNVRWQCDSLLWALRDELPAQLKYPLYLSMGWRLVAPRLKPILWILLPFVLGSLFIALKVPRDTGWHLMDTPSSLQSPIVAVHPDLQDYAFAADGIDGELFQFSKGTWIEIPEVPWKGTPARSLVVLTDTLFLATTNQIFYLHQNGQEWQTTNISNPDLFGSSIFSLASSAGQSPILFLATDVGIFLSTNTGLHWDAVALDADMEPGHVHTITTDGNTLLMATESQLWLATIQYGPKVDVVNWRRVSLAEGDGECSSLPVDDLQSLSINTVVNTGESISFVTLSGGSLLCDGNIRDHIARLQAMEIKDSPASPNMLSLAVSGRNLYVGSREGIFCRRVWDFPQSGWWLWWFKQGLCS